MERLVILQSTTTINIHITMVMQKATLSYTAEVASSRSKDMHNGIHHKCLLPTNADQIELKQNYLGQNGVRERRPGETDAHM